MRGTKPNTRYFVSYMSCRYKLKKWKGSLVLPAQTGKNNKLVLSKVPSLDFDAFMTVNYPEVVYSLRSKDLILCVLHDRIELRRNLNPTNFTVVDCEILFKRFTQIVLDPAKALYILFSYDSKVVEVNIMKTFVEEKVCTSFLDSNQEPGNDGNRETIIAANHGVFMEITKMKDEELAKVRLKKFDQNGQLLKMCRYTTPQMTVFEEGEATGSPARGEAYDRGFNFTGGICTREVFIVRKGRGIIDIAAMEYHTDKSFRELGKLKLDYDPGSDLIPNVRLQFVFFEFRGDPMILKLDGSTPLKNSLFTFKYGKFHRLSTDASGSFRKLLGSHPIRNFGAEFDRKTNKIAFWIERSTDDGSALHSTVMARLKLTV